MINCVLIGPFVFLKVCIRNLMRRAYYNQVVFKVITVPLSVALAIQTAYTNRHQIIYISVFSGFFSFLLIYWCLIPLFLIFIYPRLNQLVRRWFVINDQLSQRFARPISLKFSQILPSFYKFESNRALWPVESIRFMLKIGAVGPAFYLSYHLFFYLCFGFCLNLFVSTCLLILLSITIWHWLGVIDRDLQLFLFAIIAQYYVVSKQSYWYIPLSFLITGLILALCNQLLTNLRVRSYVEQLKQLNFRTFFEIDVTYRRFFSEIVNAIIIFYFIAQISRSDEVPRSIQVIILVFVPIYLFRHLIQLISIQSSVVLFVVTAWLLTESILGYFLHYDFLSKYFLLIFILTCYFSLIYPTIYHIIRWLTICQSGKSQQWLDAVRIFSNKMFNGFDENYIRIRTIDQPCEYLILHFSNFLVASSIFCLLPINLVFRSFAAAGSYLFMGRLMFKSRLNLVAILASLYSSAAVAMLFFRTFGLVFFPMASVIFITFISTMFILVPLTYRCLQSILLIFPWTSHLEYCLEVFFDFFSAYVDLFNAHGQKNFLTVKREIERSKLWAQFRPVTNGQQKRVSHFSRYHSEAETTKKET